MKEHWFEIIEQREREREYYGTLALITAINVDKIKDGNLRLRERLNQYFGACFPWEEDPSKVEKLKNDALIKQLDAEMEVLSKHEFAFERVGDTILLDVPKWMVAPK